MRKFISTVYLNMDDSYLLRSNIGMENILSQVVSNTIVKLFLFRSRFASRSHIGILLYFQTNSFLIFVLFLCVLISFFVNDVLYHHLLLKLRSFWK